MDHNIKKFILIVKNDIKMFFFSKKLIKSNKIVELQVNSISIAKKNLQKLEIAYWKSWVYKTAT